MNGERTELRAERLRVALTLLDAAPDYNAGRYPEARPAVSVHDTWLFQTCSREDLFLADELLRATYAARRREWEAVTQLLAAIPPGGTISDIYDLPPEQALPALRAANACGWLRPAAR